jgi:hypothetical protein
MSALCHKRTSAVSLDHLVRTAKLKYGEFEAGGPWQLVSQTFYRRQNADQLRGPIGGALHSRPRGELCRKLGLAMARAQPEANA